MEEHKTQGTSRWLKKVNRMVKVRQKISGTVRNIDRVEDYCRIRSYISTIKKQKKDVFTALVDSFKPHFDERSAII